jgi:hypothetical protein
MASKDLDLNVISFQSALRSKPIREDFTDIQNNFNLLRGEVNAGIASTASEVTSARDNYDNLTDNINARTVWGNRINGTASYQVTNDSGLTVAVNSGAGIVNGIGVLHGASATASVSSPAASNNRWDVVVVNSDNTRSIVTGTETTGTATKPGVAQTQMVLARWHIYDTTGTVSIEDLRFRSLDPFRDEIYEDAAFTYSGETLTSYTLTNVKNATQTYDVRYSGETIASIGATVDGVRFKTVYTYTGETMDSYKMSIG